MLKLRTTLLYNYPYYLILILVLLISIPRLIIPKQSNYKTTSKEAIGIVEEYSYSKDLLKITISNKEKLIVYYYSKNNKKLDIQLGDKIKVLGEFKKPQSNTTKNLFNYQKSLYNKNIFYTINASNIYKLSPTKNIYFKFKQIIIKLTDNSPYLKAFILGDKSNISKSATTSYQENGISHLLAISGMHITLLSSIVLKVLKKLKIVEEKRYFFTSLLLIIYLMIIGLSPSALRGVLFFILFSINKIYYFYIKPQNIFIVVLSISLLINPYYIYEVGFQYSFLISLILLLTSSSITGNYLQKLLKTSILSFLISIPISLYNYYQINLLSIIYNLFYVPLVSVIIFPLSIVCLFIKPLLPIYNIFIYILEKSAILLNKISFGKLIFPKLPSIIYFIYLVIIIIIIKKLTLKENKYLLILIVLLFLHYTYPTLTRTTYIKMIDVGQGDSILIHSNNESILIDTGGKSNNQEDESKIVLNTTIPLLKSLGIKKLKYLILTHGDADHMGEAKYLIENFKVKNILINNGEFNYLEKELIKQTNNIKVAKEGIVIKCGDITMVQLNTDLQDENDSSQIYYATYKNYSLLFTGDASVKSEEYILNKYNIGEIDILKVGHHGSKTSTGECLINRTNPKISLISAGEDNKFNHPHKIVLDSLNNSKIYRTDMNGTVTILFNTNLKVETDFFRKG
ncbi:MAG: DNA internalization-related competence protein ComEC/Rec2 [Bacilli bacterium]|nr:DNA internalization-related competence protein ComEC/Rec2 [Bacilli bacterium]